jgi:hypothetical protein
MYVMYYASMLLCWQLIRILVKTNHPRLRVGCHTSLPVTQNPLRRGHLCHCAGAHARMRGLEGHRATHALPRLAPCLGAHIHHRHRLLDLLDTQHHGSG